MTKALTPEPCPQCGQMTEVFYPVEAGLRLALQATPGGNSLPSKVCASCKESLTSNVSQGMKLRIEAEAREKNKMKMWKTRVNLIKQGRALMAQKSYSEAAVVYEKYLRVLEIIFNLKRGELSPKVFNNSSRSKELTVIASVYWDLMRIYDTSPAYGERMGNAARKLAEFLPYSQIYPTVVRKAEAFLRSSKNPNIVKQFLKGVKTTRGPCFLATAVYQDQPWSIELWTFRKFRDERLKKSAAGRRLILLYYTISPPIARQIQKRPLVQRLLRIVFKKMASVLIKHLKSP